MFWGKASGRPSVAAVLAAVIAFGTFGLGCTPIRYVTQAAAGQEQLNQRGIAIEEIVRGQHLDRRTRDLLAQVPKIKAFGEREGGLKHTTSYSRYVWLGRPAVVWVVSACDPVAFRPRTWSFPIVGSITYTGWFDRSEAKAYAAELANEGLDVDVRPSQAYSTLGWFDDPILSTMIAEGDEALGDLADVVLHETLHATFYVPGQSTLNESVAEFFGEGLAEKYLDEVVGKNAPEKKIFVEMTERREQRGKAMREAYATLERLYASPASREQKLALKGQIISALQAALPSGRGRSARRSITNATLIQFKTYGSGQRELAALLASCDGSFPRLLRALEPLRNLERSAPPHADPAKLLAPLLGKACPS